MNTLIQSQVRLYASAQSWIEGEAVRQLYAVAKLDGLCLAVGFPDLHPGKGSPVGAAFVAESVIYPHLIGGDIGCGMALFKTDLLRRDAKLQRWATLPFDLEHPRGDFVVIPGSRGSMTYIVKPIGEGASHAWSVAHGAGRKWARSEARLRMRERFGTDRLVQTALGGRVICEERDLLYEEAPLASIGRSSAGMRRQSLWAGIYL